jgi:sporulation-control protein spo0M
VNPEEIKQHFGEDALELIYEVLLDTSARDLADWILSMYTEQQIGEWVMQLRQDEMGE